MQIALAITFLAILAALAWFALLLRREGLPGLLYLASARLRALADAVAVGQEQHRRSRIEYVAVARTATRAIQEAL